MANQSQNVFIIDAIRSPVAKARGAFTHLRPDDLLSSILAGLIKRSDWLDPHEVDDVIIGCAMPEGDQGMNVARTACLLAGLPDSVPAMTLNRFCASGLESIAQAANRIRSGEADIVIAGGVESMTRVPMGGFHFSANPKYFNQEEHLGIAYGMGLTAEKVAAQWKITREEQDQFAVESHLKALKAQERGNFDNEIFPIQYNCHVKTNEQFDPVEQTISLSQDEGPRPGCNINAVAKLRPAFAARGCVTAGNSSQMSDGAAALIMVSENFLNQHDITPLARFIGYQVAGVAPEIMGIGPIKAIPKVLTKTGLRLSQIDWIELNEAFAAQSLAVIKELQLNPEIVNPLGGAIALGHPLGATGSIRAATLLHGLRREKKQYGMVTMCVGTGMGAAGVFESL